MRVLVLGATGQVGTELVRLPKPDAVELLLPERFDLSEAGALKQCLDKLSPDLIVNAAAYTAVDQAEKEPERAFAVNSELPSTLAAWCGARGRPLIHISTDYVFDGDKPAAYLENDAPRPLNVYGRSKLAGEEHIRAELDSHIILRTSWVFSAHRQNFVKTMLRLGKERPLLRVVADQHGRPTSARDLAETIWSMTSQFSGAGRLAWGTFHFANTGATTWHEFAIAIFAAAGAPRPEVLAISSAEYPTPAARPRNSVLDTSRYEQSFGSVPRAWDVALSDVLRELRDAENR
jgi:dTDP-4-dehydrorhamnose reductase